ncbi:peptidoglycan DD-metalloendopeptidase family protein [Pedococcus sp. NPDC057267]|uniref:peptidoglycan DD-metalloendopeptidase family protein n=1 Tax=Pedococcus sp. NPDC057267 TaxID=3346077 RepID=UPI00362530AA
MKKLALVLVPALVLMLGLPLAVALVVMTMSAPAAAEQLRTVACGGITPITGDWRPPFAQAYTVGQRGFGREFHPIFHEWRMHTGQDLVSQPGPGPVVAIGAGRVTFAGTRGGYGDVVDVEHVDEAGAHVVSRYAHLASLSVRAGQSVAAGQQLGVEGSTGDSTGNHLHFEIRIGGTPVDPVPWMLAHGAPLNGKAVAGWTPQAGEEVQEGGVGFPLPTPGSPRQASLRNPPQPIPAQIKGFYVAAAARYKIPWTLLAGIGMEETAHGRLTGTSSSGAQGLMQFMPATWATMGVDGDGDGRADINNDADSAMSAANYLTKSGVTSGPAGVRAAIFAYNHTDWYVNDVLFYAAAYGGGTVLGSTSECGPGQGNPNLPPLTNDRLRTVLTWAVGQVGDRYVMGANGPDAWDCSSFTQTAYSQIGITTPRTAGAQRDWLAAGNGFRVQPQQARPGDLIFYDSYLGPNTIGHVAMVFDPSKQSTVEAMSSDRGVTYGSYAEKASTKNIFEIWRVGNVSDQPTRAAA